jgi:hypothetical protein
MLLAGAKMVLPTDILEQGWPCLPWSRSAPSRGCHRRMGLVVGQPTPAQLVRLRPANRARSGLLRQRGRQPRSRPAAKHHL